MIVMKSMKRTVLTDMRRAFCSIKFPISIGIVIMVLCIATLEGIALNEDVLYVFSIVMYGMPAMIILIAGTFIYGDSLCLDVEHRYIISSMIRSGTKSYVVSKIFVIFFAAVMSICLGIVIYASVLHLFMPWTQTVSNQYEFLMQSGSFRFLLEHNMFILYFFMWGLQYGMLAGVLAVLSAYVSLFITNKMLVLATPFLCYYFIDFALAILFQEKYSVMSIYSASNNIMGNDVKSFALAVGISCIFLAVIGKLIEKKIKKEYLS